MANSTRLSKYTSDVCAIEDCSKVRRDREWCDKHYKRWQTHGDPNFMLQADCKGKICVIEDCERPRRKRLWCNPHYTVQWRTENPELALKNMQQCWHNRMALEKGAEGKHTREEWEELLNQYNGLCAYCGERKGTERDHVVPLSKGGTHYISNILPSCKSCNSSKHNKLLKEWKPNYERV